MKTQLLSFKKSGLTRSEWQKLKKLSTPAKIQDFLNSIPFNFEKRPARHGSAEGESGGGETHHSPRLALKSGQAHCFEGALIAATALWIQGREPLLLDLKTARPDLDHVVALFKEGKHWGAISKTNHAVLRYREPVYRSVRELAMSYFHEYFLNNGKKTLRSFSKPFDLSKLGTNWITTEENLADLAYTLDISPHSNILSPKQVRNLRKAEKIETQAGKITEYLL